MAVYPPAQLTISPNDTVCPNDQVTLAILGSTGTVYWSTGAFGLSITVNPAVTSTYYAIDDFGGLNDTIFATITVLQVSSFIHIHPGGIHCHGDSLAYIHLINPYGNIWWSTGDTVAVIYIDPPVTTTYTVINSAGNGCADTVSITIQVRPPTLPSITVQNEAICNGRSVSVTLMNPVGNILWSTGDTTDVIAVWPPAQLYVINDHQGYCPDTGYVSLPGTAGDIQLPNAFSPNQDSENDAFKSQGSAPVEFQLVIYDRWGNQVFFSKDPSEGWDGNFFHIACETGVYIWRLSYFNSCSGKTEFKSGNVTLLR